MSIEKSRDIYEMPFCGATMLSTCCVVNCSTRAKKGVKLFCFPTDPNRKDSWVRAVHQVNWQANEQSKICYCHFVNRKPSHFPDHPDYMPSIFPYQSSKQVSSNRKLGRYSRLLQRWRKSVTISRQVPIPQEIEVI